MAARLKKTGCAGERPCYRPRSALRFTAFVRRLLMQRWWGCLATISIMWRSSTCHLAALSGLVRGQNFGFAGPLRNKLLGVGRIRATLAELVLAKVSPDSRD